MQLRVLTQIEEKKMRFRLFSECARPTGSRPPGRRVKWPESGTAPGRETRARGCGDAGEWMDPGRRIRMRARRTLSVAGHPIAYCHCFRRAFFFYFFFLHGRRSINRAGTETKQRNREKWMPDNRSRRSGDARRALRRWGRGRAEGIPFQVEHSAVGIIRRRAPISLLAQVNRSCPMASRFFQLWAQKPTAYTTAVAPPWKWPSVRHDAQKASGEIRSCARERNKYIEARYRSRPVRRHQKAETTRAEECGAPCCVLGFHSILYDGITPPLSSDRIGTRCQGPPVSTAVHSSETLDAPS